MSTIVVSREEHRREAVTSLDDADRAARRDDPNWSLVHCYQMDALVSAILALSAPAKTTETADPTAVELAQIVGQQVDQIARLKERIRELGGHTNDF